MTSKWVDFAAVKRAVTMDMVLERYQVNWLREGKDGLTGRCPIHKGEGERSFHVSRSKNVFHCFSCEAKGNVLDFVASMEQCPVRDAAIKLQEWFAVAPPAADNSGRKSANIKVESGTDDEVNREEVSRQLESGTPGPNPPLSFTLKGIDPSHPYLEKRGIARQTAEYFGVGFFPGKGLMSRRVVIPIHNEREELVAYAGRSVDDSEPRYKLPSGFHKGAVLFNFHRLRQLDDAGTRRVIVVEGFFDCMKVVQAGFPNVVALMGRTLSAQQEALLAGFNEVVLILDGDEAGQTASAELTTRLAHRMFVRVIDVDGQPDQLSSEQIQNLLSPV
jgi:DNA primase